MGQSNTKVNESKLSNKIRIDKIKEDKIMNNNKLFHLNLIKNIHYITIVKGYFNSFKSKTKLNRVINILNCLHLKSLYFNTWFIKQKQFYIEKYHINYRKILMELSYNPKNITNNIFNKWLYTIRKQKYIRILNNYNI